MHSLVRTTEPHAVHLVHDQRWTDDLARALAAIADEFTPLDWYRAGVEGGSLTVEAAYASDGPCGFVIWRIDHYAKGRALVIVAAIGFHPAFDLAGCVLPVLESMARACGCSAVRFHTKRNGLAMKATAHGYSAVEYVFRRVLT